MAKNLYLLTEYQNVQVRGSSETLWVKKWVKNFCKFTVNIKHLFNNVFIKCYKKEPMAIDSYFTFLWVSATNGKIFLLVRWNVHATTFTPLFNMCFFVLSKNLTTVQRQIDMKLFGDLYMHHSNCCSNLRKIWLFEVSNKDTIILLMM